MAMLKLTQGAEKLLKAYRNNKDDVPVAVVKALAIRITKNYGAREVARLHIVMGLQRLEIWEGRR